MAANQAAMSAASSPRGTSDEGTNVDRPTLAALRRVSGRFEEAGAATAPARATAPAGAESCRQEENEVSLAELFVDEDGESVTL